MSRDAAEITEMALSTYKHRIAGRRSAEDYGKTRRLLTAEEESILLWKCDITIVFRTAINPGGCTGLALEIVQKRDPNAVVGKAWVRNCLYKRHSEIKS